MKVAIVSRGIPSPSDPVYGVFEFDQARALAGQGLDVAFIILDFRSVSAKRKTGLFQYDREGVHVFELSLPINVYRRGLPVLQHLLLIPFRTMLKRFGKPDIVHVHFYSIAAIASIIKRKYSIPIIVTEHSSKLNKPKETISSLDQRLARKAFSSCNQLISVSHTLRNNLLNNFQADSIVIPNMVDNNAFHIREVPPNDSPFVFVSVGHLLPIKGFDTLIKAFAQVKDNAMLYIIGDGPEKEKILHQINQLQLEHKINLLGQVGRKEINKVFQKSHAFVLASRSETFGVCYIEAMYAGLPVIATRCGGPESFVDNSNGILVPVDDEAALIDAMLQIQMHYSEYDGKSISENCFQRFSPNAVAQEIIKVYQQYC